MNFKKFTEKVVRVLKERLGDECTVTVTEVLKNNDIRMTGVVIMQESDDIFPTVYLEGPYRQYQDGTSVLEIVDGIIEAYEESNRNIGLDMDFFRDFSQVKDKIFYKLINRGQNKELLGDIPYFEWHDLAVVFYYAMEEECIGKASILLHNSHLDMWGKTAEEIYCTASRNMLQGMPEYLVLMQEMLGEMAGIKLAETAPALYVLTNKERRFGASAMLYSEKIRELADELGSDLLILPSSVHEVLLLADDQDWKYGFYRRMVNEVNTTQVEPEEILSFNLYRYSREKSEIEQIAE